MYIFCCSDRDPNRDHTLHLVNIFLQVFYSAFFPFCNLCVEKLHFFVYRDFHKLDFADCVLVVCLIQARSYSLLRKMSFCIALLLMCYEIQS